MLKIADIFYQLGDYFSGQKTGELAIEIERLSRHLGNYTENSFDNGSWSMTDLLVSSRDMLADAARKSAQDRSVLRRPISSSAQTAAPVSRVVATPPTAPIEIIQPAVTAAKCVGDDSANAPVSSIANEVIGIRDWIFMSKDSGKADPTAMLSTIDTKLKRCLSSEGIEPFEDEGCIDQNRHQVLDTTATTEPDDDEKIVKTIRPGYLRNNMIYRPQQVNAYVLD